MRIVLTIDDKLGEKIEKAAVKEKMKRNDWVIRTISESVSGSGSKKSESLDITSALENKEKEISNLKEEIRLQIELREAYAQLIEEKDNRIDDLKEEIARIEVFSVTAADQINQDKEERIKDLNKMLEHLQGQAAAHSRALQSAIISREKEDENEEENNGTQEHKDLIEKPKWMFWK
ncbi:MAG: hypothetical protein JW931_04520 [Methanomicrobiaceae archaeon]|nr:hypothetical protein [Methanomicrobiaceae archaeon]